MEGIKITDSCKAEEVPPSGSTGKYDWRPLVKSLCTLKVDEALELEVSQFNKATTIDRAIKREFNGKFKFKVQRRKVGNVKKVYITRLQ